MTLKSRGSMEIFQTSKGSTIHLSLGTTDLISSSPISNLFCISKYYSLLFLSFNLIKTYLFNNPALIPSTACTLTCTDGSNCGGDRGQISAYVIQASSAQGLNITLKDFSGADPTGRIIRTGEV